MSDTPLSLMNTTRQAIASIEMLNIYMGGLPRAKETLAELYLIEFILAEVMNTPESMFELAVLGALDDYLRTIEQTVDGIVPGERRKRS